MTTSTFVLWSGLAAMLAGLVTAAGPLLGEDRDPALEIMGFLVRAVLIATALVGIYLFQKDEAGVLGLIGAALAFVGNLGMLIDFFIGGSFYPWG